MIGENAAIGEREFLLDALKGNESAVDFCLLLGGIQQVWDDLVDGDKAVTAGRINQALIGAIIGLPLNGFYCRHFGELQPIMRVGIMDWMTANALERGDDHDKTLAFMLRDSIVSIVVQCAYLVGGHDWAISKAPSIRRYFHDETLAEYSLGLAESNR